MANPNTRPNPQGGQAFSNIMLGSRYALGGAARDLAASMMDARSTFHSALEDFDFTVADLDASADWTRTDINTGTTANASAVGDNSLLEVFAGTVAARGAAFFQTGSAVTAAITPRGAGEFPVQIWAARVALGLGADGVSDNAWVSKAFVGVSSANAAILSNANDVVTVPATGCIGFHFTAANELNFVVGTSVGVSTVFPVKTANAVRPSEGRAAAGNAAVPDIADHTTYELAFKITYNDPIADSVVEAYIDNQRFLREVLTPPLTPGKPIYVSLNAATVHTNLSIDWQLTAQSKPPTGV